MVEANLELKHKVELAKVSKKATKRGEIRLVLDLTVRDKDGNITDHRVQEGKSFLRGFIEILYVIFLGNCRWDSTLYNKWENGYYIRNNKNLKRLCFARTENKGYTFDADGGVGEEDRGVAVGTGNTAPNISDYDLETIIDHGTGSGELQYGAMTYGLPATDATLSHFTLTRDFANDSGGSITVNEAGVYYRVIAYQYGTDHVHVLGIRDIISGGISVPDGQTLTVNYRLQAAA